MNLIKETKLLKVGAILTVAFVTHKKQMSFFVNLNTSDLLLDASSTMQFFLKI